MIYYGLSFTEPFVFDIPLSLGAISITTNVPFVAGLRISNIVFLLALGSLGSGVISPLTCLVF